MRLDLWIFLGILCSSQAKHKKIEQPNPGAQQQPPQGPPQCEDLDDLACQPPVAANILLAPGGSYVDPDEPCTEYTCFGQSGGGVRMSKKDLSLECETPVLCDNDKNKPAYTVEGECCPRCDYNLEEPDGDDDNSNWSEWSVWGPCTTTCGGGTRIRQRECIELPEIEVDCRGLVKDRENCSTDPCPIDGNWSPWTPWSSCTVSCGPGTRERTRTCDNPAPQHGGDDCVGSDAEPDDCDHGPCPINGEWSTWSSWTDCNATCGPGSRQRSRQCDDPPPQHDGDDCIGDESETEDCILKECPIDGGWSSWSSWSPCTVTCGPGTRQRSRVCDNPEPQHGGKDCPGEKNDSENCKEKECPINGVWSPWTPWTSCSVTCGPGTHERSRQCNNPPPQHDGEDCEGESREDDQCNNGECPNPCDPNPCFQGRQCTIITEEEFSCEPCPEGYVGDGVQCVPDTECDEEPCFPGVQCNELDSGFQCDPCPVGYTGNQPAGKNREEAKTNKQNCVDINECEDDTICGEFGVCMNTVGSYNCVCRIGYNNIEGQCRSCFDNIHGHDQDNDGVRDDCDNCPQHENSNQRDEDADGQGDVCDDDTDGDGINNDIDPCPSLWNRTVLDIDYSDSDEDGVANECDNCLYTRNAKQCDIDQDGIGDCCQPKLYFASDDDHTFVADNCNQMTNHDQANLDQDIESLYLGDACDPDDDGDGVNDISDNCPLVYNPQQKEDDCEGDFDGDGVVDKEDVCPKKYLVKTTNFMKNFEVTAGREVSGYPPLHLIENGNMIHHRSSKHPYFLMSNDILESMKYSGSVSVGSSDENGVFGMVFNYLSNRRFNVLRWSKTGLELWIVNTSNSNQDISQCLRQTFKCDEYQFKQATCRTSDDYQWELGAVYHWEIFYSAKNNCTSVKVYNEQRNEIGTCTVSCETNKGGKVGVYADEIEDIIWYDLKYECLDPGNPQLDCTSSECPQRKFVDRFFVEDCLIC